MSKIERPYIVVGGLMLVPAIIWMTLQPFGERWSDAVMVLRSLSQLSGIFGLVLFSFTLMLSARFPWMEKIMGPLNKVYTAHHTLGTAAFAMLLTHPIFVLVNAIVLQKPNLARYIIPGLDNALTWGILALWTLIVLMVLTLYLRPRYPLWKKTHQFLGLSLFFAGLHSLFITSDVSVSPLLRWYLLSVAIFGIVSYTAYTLLNFVTVKRYAYVIDKVDRLSDTVISVHLKPGGQALVSQPGQFIFIRFKIDGKWSEIHPFSLTEKAGKQGLGISMKVLGDDTARFMQTLAVGMSAQIEGPFGMFGAEMRGVPRLVCVAGGIGTTPFLALLPSLESQQSADFYYAIKNKPESVYLPALRRLEEKRKGLRIIPWLSDDQGYLTADIIQKQSALTADDHIFLCGPPGMMKALKKRFIALGIPREHLHSEEFSFE